MDHYSILDQGSANPVPDPVSADRGLDRPRPGVPLGTISALRFPGEDGGKSLAEMAQRDLHVALQLLVERAQYITGASGAAIALREHEELICCARTGSSAPEVGAQLQVSSGLTGESVRTREVLRCNDAETDPRVNRESCKTMGIASVMVMPLLQDHEVVGVFELLSDRPHAFEERDVIALQRLGEMISTAIEHAAAVKHGIEPVSGQTSVQPGISVSGSTPEVSASRAEVPTTTSGVVPDTIRQMDSASSPQEAAPEANRVQLENIRQCQNCGFPVSGSRTICLDCEAAQDSEEHASSGSKAAPAFLADLENPQEESWLRAHGYTVGIVLMAVLTAVLLLWLRPI